jgi:lysophospholipase L1-like esterase
LKTRDARLVNASAKAAEGVGFRHSIHWGDSRAMTTLFRRIRDAWVMIGITLLLVVLANVLLKAVLPESAGYELVRPGAVEPSKRSADFYADADWADGYFAEHRQARHMRWEPYVYWRRRAFDGTTITIDARGLRATWSAEAAEAGPRIFVFGGSTVWGTGARDAHTIPSAIAKGLAERGIAAQVTNFGESGYVSGQETIALLRELQAGNIPDLVIFYDGVNDVFSALQAGRAGIPQNEGERQQDFRATKGLDDWLAALPHVLGGVERLARWLSPPGEPPPAEVLAPRIVSAYLANVRAVRAVARDYGFGAVFFWQPTVFAKRRPSAGEQAIVDASLAYHRDLQLASDDALRVDLRRAPDVTDLSTLFDAVEGSVYLDASHLSEEGNRLVADAIVAVIAERFGPQLGGS